MHFVEVGEGEESGEDGDLKTFAVVEVEAGRRGRILSARTSRGSQGRTG